MEGCGEHLFNGVIGWLEGGGGGVSMTSSVGRFLEDIVYYNVDSLLCRMGIHMVSLGVKLHGQPTKQSS